MRIEIEDKYVLELAQFLYKVYDAMLSGGGPDVHHELIESILKQINTNTGEYINEDQERFRANGTSIVWYPDD